MRALSLILVCTLIRSALPVAAQPAIGGSSSTTSRKYSDSECAAVYRANADVIRQNLAARDYRANVKNYSAIDFSHRAEIVEAKAGIKFLEGPLAYRTAVSSEITSIISQAGRASDIAWRGSFQTLISCDALYGFTPAIVVDDGFMHPIVGSGPAPIADQDCAASYMIASAAAPVAKAEYTDRYSAAMMRHMAANKRDTAEGAINVVNTKAQDLAQKLKVGSLKKEDFLASLHHCDAQSGKPILPLP